MSTGASSWALYVDESGRFQGVTDADDDDAFRPEPGHSIVAGVLAPRALSTDLASIEERLCAANPLAPWPHHAWHTHQTAMHALWSLWTAKKSKRVASSHRAKSIWRASCGETLDRCLAALRAGREPARRDVEHLSRRLRACDDALHLELTASRLEAVAGTVRVIESLASSEAPGAVLLFAAADAPGREDDPGELVDPYLGALAAVVQRVAHSLLLRGGSHDVTLRVLGRNVRARFGASTLTMKMTTTHLGAVVQSACAGGRAEERGGAQVRFHLEPVSSYGALLHPLHVVADFVAFSARKILASRRSLAELTQDVPRVVGLQATLEGRLVPLAAGQPSEVPLVGADGSAFAFLDRAFRGGRPRGDELADGLRPWVREQALSLAAALGVSP